MDKKKVLLVDDESDFLEIMGRRVESWGYEVIRASNGSEALKALSENGPHVMILDYIMPDIDGIELLRKVRGAGNRIPVIMFSAKPQPEAIKDGEKLNIAAFIPKLSPYVDTQSNLKSALNMAFKNIGH